jgi:glyoxylase-like metal-dependent hydrolase (beta-lactamase superfamily II)
MKNVTRRDMLKMMGTAGAAAVGSALLPKAGLVTAQPTEIMGRVVQVLKGDVKIHTYLAPEYSFLVSSHIIETPDALVIVDTQFLQSAGSEVVAYAESLGKPIERILLSHAHPDHWSGANLFADTPFISTASIAAAVQADIDNGGVEQRAGLVGESEVPAEPRVPEGVLETGETSIAGLTFEIESVANAEAPEQLIIRLPDLGTVIVQDLLYNNAHFFPGVDRANWITILEGLRGLSGYDTVLVGHGLPATLGLIEPAIQYLEFANEVAASAESADDIAAALQAEYPSYAGAGILSFWGLFFQPS